MSAIKLNKTQKSKIMSFLRTCSGIYVGNDEKTFRNKPWDAAGVGSAPRSTWWSMGWATPWTSS